MIRTSALFHTLGVATIALALLVCLLSLLCILYVLYFRVKTHQHHLFALRDLNSLWAIRIMLSISAGLCCLVELLRLPLLRYRGWFLSSVGHQTQENFCKGYLVLSQGFMGPFFYLAALFLVHGSLQNDPISPRKKGNGRAVLNILGCCLPVFLLQLFFVIIGPGIGFRDGQGLGKLLPRYFTKTYEGVHYEGNREMVLCAYPLLSTIVLGTFGIMYVSYFLYVCWRMLSLVINKRMQCRVYGLVFAVVLFLPVKVIFLVLTIFRKPNDDIFELFSFMGFVMTVLTAILGQGILVIRPISDALAVRWVFNSIAHFEKDRQSFGSGSIEVFSVSSLGRDGEESLLGK